MSDMMTFPKTWEEYEKSYGFTDTKEIYTNGIRLIPSFRVEQWLEHTDAVEVTRCKDCRFGYLRGGWTTTQYRCQKFSNDIFSGDHFCAWGEPKPEEIEP